MSEQEMIDAAIAAYESGEWGEWLLWLAERGVREIVGPPVPMVPAFSGVCATYGSVGTESTTTAYLQIMEDARLVYGSRKVA